jgi:hypothetical protein
VLGRSERPPRRDDDEEPDPADLFDDILALPRVTPPESSTTPAPAVAKAATPLGAPKVRRLPVLSPATLPGLDGYGDAALDEAPLAGTRTGGVSGGWRTATVMFACAALALGVGLGLTFYELVDYRNRTTELEGILPGVAIQVGFVGDNVQGIGYFAPQFARGVLTIDGLQPVPATQKVVIWAQSQQDGISAVTFITPDQYGSRLYVEIRRLPSDLVRLFATAEPASKTLPSAPTGKELFSGEPPVGLGPLQSPPTSTP